MLSKQADGCQFWLAWMSNGQNTMLPWGLPMKPSLELLPIHKKLLISKTIIFSYTYRKCLKHTLSVLEPIKYKFYEIANMHHAVFFNTLYSSGSPTFSHHVPCVEAILSPHTTFLQEKSIYQTSCNQKFGKPFQKPKREVHKNSWINYQEPDK